jgi:hypothetical protein
VSPAEAKRTLQRNRDRRLTTLWLRGLPSTEIAAQLGFYHGAGVRHAAQRLGLPKRRPGSDTSKATLASAHARQVRGEKAQLARLEQAEKRQHGPTPQFYRCQECGGVSEGRERHPRCEEAA